LNSRAVKHHSQGISSPSSGNKFDKQQDPFHRTRPDGPHFHAAERRRTPPPPLLPPPPQLTGEKISGAQYSCLHADAGCYYFPRYPENA
jgi:hypothetical protein